MRLCDALDSEESDDRATHCEKTQFRCHLDFFKLSKICAASLSIAQICERRTVSTTLVSVNRLDLLFGEIRSSGDDRARTDNLRLARAALSQLSYVPGMIEIPVVRLYLNRSEFLVGVGGLEPPTSALSEPHSNQLSYTPVLSKPHMFTGVFSDVQSQSGFSRKTAEGGCPGTNH